MPTPTLSDVAKAAGVHTGTASRALNLATRGQVSAGTARRVAEAAAALGYVPNPIARGLRTGRSYVVGVVIPDLTNPLFPPIVRGIEDVLVEHSYTALLANTDNDEDRERRLFTAIRARQGDGFIIATAHRGHGLLAEVAEEGLAVVLVNRVTDDRRLPSVSADDTAGVRAAVDHLVEQGHIRIAHVAGPQDLSTGHGRYRAYLEALSRHGLPADPALVSFADRFSEQAGRRATETLLARGRAAFTAVLATNDLVALGALEALESAGRRCPQDVSVVGFNDMPLLDRLRPPLTTVHIPHYRIGAEAARLLLHRISHPDAPLTSLLLPATLVIRGSTAPPARRRRRAPSPRT